MKKLFIALALILGSVLLIVFFNRNRLKLLYTSLNAFKDENLSYSFQHMAEIQPTNEIERSGEVYHFSRDEKPLPETFRFNDADLSVSEYLDKTKTLGFLVIQDDVIRHESYYMGADENTLFSSNSMGKSFVSALMGSAIADGYIDSVDAPVSKYIPEFVGTKIAEVPIKAFLQMASGLDFDEDTDMSKYSLKTLLGMSSMNIISKLGLKEEPLTYRRYLSINTEVLGAVIANATGKGLAEYMQEKLWSKIGAENNAYWTLSNGKELAMGGLSISLRDFARFAALYLNNGNINGEQVLPKAWIADSLDISAEYSKPGANHDSYNAIGYGYQWWIPEGDEGEFLAIGVYSQWIYINPTKNIIVVKTSAYPNFMEKNHELCNVELFRAIAAHYDEIK